MVFTTMLSHINVAIGPRALVSYLHSELDTIPDSATYWHSLDT